MRFSVNGSDQGIAFRVSKSELAGRALFPHVLTKNQVSDYHDDDHEDHGHDHDDDHNHDHNDAVFTTHFELIIIITMPILGLHRELWSNARPPLPSRARLHPNWPARLRRRHCQVWNYEMICLNIFIYVTKCGDPYVTSICYNVCDVTGDQNRLPAGLTVKPSWWLVCSTLRLLLLLLIIIMT